MPRIANTLQPTYNRSVTNEIARDEKIYYFCHAVSDYAAIHNPSVGWQERINR